MVSKSGAAVDVVYQMKGVLYILPVTYNLLGSTWCYLGPSNALRLDTRLDTKGCIQGCIQRIGYKVGYKRLNTKG